MAEWSNGKDGGMADGLAEWRPNGGMAAKWWPNGRMVEWRNGRMARMVEWLNGKNGKIVEWQNGRMAKMAEWRMEWQNGGRMAGWLNGG